MSLERECRTLCRYLVGVEPTPYLVECYVVAHRSRSDLAARTAFDAAAVRLARTGTACARVCDAYSRLLAPRGLLRRKLSLLVALLESSPGLHRRVEAVDEVGRPVLVLRLGGQLVVWLLALGAGLLLLLPVHGLSRLVSARRVGRV